MLELYQSGLYHSKHGKDELQVSARQAAITRWTRWMTSATSNQRILPRQTGEDSLPPSYLTEDMKEVSLIRLRMDLHVSVPPERRICRSRLGDKYQWPSYLFL